MTEACGIIAGAGSFPFHVAREAKRQGLKVIVLGIAGWVDPTLAAHADVYEEIAVGQIGQLITTLKTHQTRCAIMAGKVTKEVLFDSRVCFDADALLLLSQVKEYSVNTVLGALAARLAQDGVELLDSSTFLKENLCPPGVLTQRKPTSAEQEDMRLGAQAARQMAELDIGQTVVVKGKVIVAVEALEGTDVAIARAGQLAGKGCVVVKVASPKQDMRFDLPILGPKTVETALAAGVGCLAVEAGKTLLLDRETLISNANAAQLAIVGLELS